MSLFIKEIYEKLKYNHDRLNDIKKLINDRKYFLSDGRRKSNWAKFEKELEHYKNKKNQYVSMIHLLYKILQDHNQLVNFCNEYNDYTDHILEWLGYEWVRPHWFHKPS